MRDDELREQRRQGVCDAQLLVLLDRIRAHMLLLDHTVNPMSELTQHRSKSSQDVYDEAFFAELEERLRRCC
jgi:hypothetical protein